MRRSIGATILGFAAFLSLPCAAADGIPLRVPLCKALESVRPGDQIPVVVSGVYAVDYLYDPSVPRCQLYVMPLTCVEFAPGVALPPKFAAELLDGHRIRATFQGVLYGPKLVADVVGPSASIRARLFGRWAAAYTLRYCSHQFRTKLVVQSILALESATDDIPVPEQFGFAKGQPVPVAMEVPRYPDRARMIDYEGTVLVLVEVEAGVVKSAGVEFGDPVLVDEVIQNVRTWRFAPDVTFSFEVKYEFRLEKRTPSEGEAPKVELRLPEYVSVTGRARGY